ncbi:MAG: DUF6531 domain-containing protein [Pseudomonadota bacterium]
MQCARASSREFRLARTASLSALLVALCVGVAHADSPLIDPPRGWQGGNTPRVNYDGTPGERISDSCAHFGTTFKRWASQTTTIDARGHEKRTWDGECETGRRIRLQENAYCPGNRGLRWSSASEPQLCSVGTAGGPVESVTNPQLGCTTGNPIHLASGTKIQRETDYRVSDLLQFTRFYRHRAVSGENGAEPVLDALYGRWTHTYSRALFFTWSAGYEDESSLPGHIFVTRPDGRQALYLRQGDNAVWRPLNAENAELTRASDGTWRLRNPQNETEHYDASGALTRITEVGGYHVTLTRSADTIVVRDAHGKTLRLSLDANARVTTLTRATGDTVNYAYDANGVISEVTYPDNRSRRYTYEASGQRYLTGIVNNKLDRHR